MKITWIAHSCFLLENGGGVRLLTDPYGECAGYTLRKIRTDIVTVSHKHEDHNNLAMAEGDFTLVDKAGTFSVKGFTITGIVTKHDDQGGAKRGQNIAYVIECDGYRVCHLGDLGHLLSAEQIKEIGRVDILMIPVGGNYTIDAVAARKVAASLNALIVMPMHYKTDACAYDIEDEQPFLDRMQQDEYAIVYHHGSTREYLPGDMPRRHAVVVMDHLC